MKQTITESGEVLLDNPGIKGNDSSNSKDDNPRKKFFSFSFYCLIYVIMLGSVGFNGLMYARMENFKNVLLSLQTDGFKHRKVTEPLSVVTDPQICVPWDFLAHNVSETEHRLQNFTMRRKMGEKIRCVSATNGQIVKKIIEKGVERQLRKEKNKGEFGAVKHVTIHQKDGRKFTSWSNKPVAHLLGCVREQKHIGAPYEPQEIRRWLIPGEHRNTILKNGLTYRDGRIIISTEGLYYVYSQVLFIESYVVAVGEQPEEDKLKHRCHYIYRYNLYQAINGEDELLRGKATKCWSKYKEIGEHTSYLGGVFYLRPGDELFVKVSNISEVSRLALSNNFGVYML